MSAFSSWMDANGGAIVKLLLIVLLIVLIMIAVRLFVIFGNLKKTTLIANDSLDIVKDYVGEMKMPVRAIVNTSMSIEALRAASESQIKSFFDTVTKNFDTLVNAIKELWLSVTKNDTKKIAGDDELTVVKLTDENSVEKEAETNE